MKKINVIFNTIMGCFLGVFIGNSIYTFVDYKTHPALYEVNSAPWYTGILMHGAVTFAVLVIWALIKVAVKWYIRSKN